MADSFRFQNLEIWKRSATVSIELFNLADEIESKRHFRWAEQLRAAVLSITNNIAEGSGSYSEKNLTLTKGSPNFSPNSTKFPE